MGEPKLEGVKTALKICQGIKIGGQCPNSCPLLAACQMGCGGAPRMILDCIQQLEAERDAAVETIYEMAKCITEDVCEWCDGAECERLCMMHTILRPGFKWRGVQKEA